MKRRIVSFYLIGMGSYESDFVYKHAGDYNQYDVQVPHIWPQAAFLLKI